VRLSHCLRKITQKLQLALPSRLKDATACTLDTKKCDPHRPFGGIRCDYDAVSGVWSRKKFRFFDQETSLFGRAGREVGDLSSVNVVKRPIG